MSSKTIETLRQERDTALENCERWPNSPYVARVYGKAQKALDKALYAQLGHTKTHTHTKPITLTQQKLF